VDVGGRLRKDAAGRVVLGFGKHAGRPLADVARTDPSYLSWVLATVPLLDDARQRILRAANGDNHSAHG
jgi:DNA polymerase-3 subunit epsilon